MNKKMKVAGTVAIALLLLTGAFAMGTGQVNWPDSMAQVMSVFNTSPSFSVTADSSGTRGPLIAGQAQSLGSFTLRAKGIKDPGYLQKIKITIDVKDTNKNLIIKYAYIKYGFQLPLGVNRYGYPGSQPYGNYSMPITLVRSGNQYVATVTPNWQFYSSALASGIVVVGTPYYASGLKSPNQEASLKVTLSPVLSYQDQNCKTIHYGYKNMYSYPKCTSVTKTINGVATGPLLKMSRPYGYGYIAPGSVFYR